jgi:hypothetical protein
LSVLKKNAVQFYDNLIKKTQKRKKKWEDL